MLALCLRGGWHFLQPKGQPTSGLDGGWPLTHPDLSAFGLLLLNLSKILTFSPLQCFSKVVLPSKKISRLSSSRNNLITNQRCRWPQLHPNQMKLPLFQISSTSILCPYSQSQSPTPAQVQLNLTGLSLPLICPAQVTRARECFGPNNNTTRFDQLSF